MKRYKNLYDKIISIENIALAHRKAKKGKGHYSDVRAVEKSPCLYFESLHKKFLFEKYKTSDYSIITRDTSGKTRQIFKLPYFPDRIVHHCIMNIMEPIWEKTLIRDTYSSIKGRGIHDGVKRVKGFLKDKKGTRYCLKMDVKKFYPSIDHGILKLIIRRKIKCPQTLRLLDEIIDSSPGLPIGNYLSQYFGNLYLSGLDHWCKESIKIKYYARYCDDIVIFSNSKRHLHIIKDMISNYCELNLRLQIKDTWQVFPTAIRGVDFLGYRFFGGYTLIRKSIVRNFKRKVRKSDHSSAVSYYGWLKHGNGHRLWNKYGVIL